MSNSESSAPHNPTPAPLLGGVNKSRPGWARLQATLLDLLFPPRCVECGQRGARLCPTCQRSLKRLAPPWCARCGQPGAHVGSSGAGCPSCAQHPAVLNGIRAAFEFGGPLRAAIHALKYKQGRDLARPLAELMLPSWRHLPQAVDVVIAPVPLHPERQRERGYNQSELLACFLGPAVGVPVASDLLERTRATMPQVTLDAQARRRNVDAAFGVRPGRTQQVAGRRFVLLDDVCTTGATLGACAVALTDAGAQNVWAFTLARARWAPSASGSAPLTDQLPL